MDVETYLKSERAADGVAGLLRAPAIMDYAAIENRQPASIQINGLVPWWHVDREGAWRCVWLDRCEYQQDECVRPVFAYFRPEHDRYIVTDMGEAVRALRLRTGRRADQACLDVIRKFRMNSGGDWLSVADSHIHHRNPTWGTPAIDLPRAICAIMLAAYKISRLDVQQ